MALRRTLSHRPFSKHISSIFSPRALSNPAPFRAERPVFQTPLPTPFRAERPVFQTPLPTLPLGPALAERIRLEGLARPEEGVGGLTVEEARKVVRAAQMEAARARLRGMRETSVSHAEFVRVCCQAAGGEQGRVIARALDDAGAVIVLGQVVLLRPDQVAKAIESVIHFPAAHESDAQTKELKEMEEKMAEIDGKAEAQVKRELWCGLAFFALQTAGFMRLTFWELSWDVMEPVCFFVTSLYFIAGYAFFLRTSRDPSFEGFFDSRFAAKQRRLIRAHNFDMQKFNQLKRASRPPPVCQGVSPSSHCDCRHRGTLLGVRH